MKKRTILIITVSLIVFVFNIPIVESCCIIESQSFAGPEIGFLVAKKLGLYEKFGLKNDFEFSDPKWIVSQLRQGKDIVGILPSTLAADLIFQDKNLVIVGTIFKGWDSGLWSKPSIEDLKKRLEDVDDVSV